MELVAGSLGRMVWAGALAGCAETPGGGTMVGREAGGEEWHAPETVASLFLQAADLHVVQAAPLVRHSHLLVEHLALPRVLDLRWQPQQSVARTPGLFLHVTSGGGGAGDGGGTGAPAGGLVLSSVA